MRRGGRKGKSDLFDLAQKAQDRGNQAIDDLAAFEEFQATILPALRQDLNSGLTAEQLREKYLPLVQAAMLTTALASPDAKARLTAGKDIIDRAEGTATQRIEQTHRLEKLPEEQLDALLLSEISQINPDDKTTH